MGSLSDWANKNSQYIKIDDGQACKGVYGGYEMGHFRGNEIVNYKIGEQTLSSTSKKLALKMDKVKEGSLVKITKQGSGTDTTYFVEVLEEPKGSQEVAWDE